jgi:hypothetical protein
MQVATMSIIVLLASALAACSGSDDERSVPLPSGSASGSASGAGVGSGGTPAGTRAVANTWAQMKVLDEAFCTQVGAPPDCGYTPPVPPADEDLFLHFSDLDVSCDAPNAHFVGCESHWYVRLYVPVSAQQVGTYDLGASAVFAGFQETFAGDECEVHIGGLPVGTVELTSIEADRVDFVLDADPPSAADPSGTYTALRCP